MAEDFIDKEKVIVILGDNIIEEDITKYVQAFKRQNQGARLLLKSVPDPERFGVADVRGKRIVQIIEKPKNPKTNYAVTGVYMYDSQVFKMIRKLKPSKRGELEITDVNNMYIKKGIMEFNILKGFWSDAGTFDSLLRANKLVAQKTRSKK